MIKGIFYSLMLCVSISTLNGMPFLHLMVQLPQVGVEQANAPVKKGSKIDSKDAPVRNQVASHKPAKKSAGRGR